MNKKETFINGLAHLDVDQIRKEGRLVEVLRSIKDEAAALSVPVKVSESHNVEVLMHGFCVLANCHPKGYGARLVSKEMIGQRGDQC